MVDIQYKDLIIMKQTTLVVIVAALFLCCMAVPVSAVIQEVTLKGTVATLSPPTNTLSIEHPQQYGCSYPATGAPVCTYTPMSVEVLTGTVPDAAAFSIFTNGDPVVATSIGGAGETWITLAKLFGSRPNEEFLTDIVGDISTIPTPLIGNYALDATTVPDCAACTGTTCTAQSSNVKVMSEGKEVFTQALKPGETLNYNGRNDGSGVAVTFVKGQALSSSCPGKAGMTGPQAISVYVVKIVPPISAAQVDIRTATTTRPEEALRTAAPTVASTSSPTMIPTTKAGMLPLAAIGAIGIAGLILVMRKE
ncbi:MAG: hypothetical protein Q7J03_04155 [Methanoregula sp.]|nr:hypothetical protein [Methanoregula sp.]